MSATGWKNAKKSNNTFKKKKSGFKKRKDLKFDPQPFKVMERKDITTSTVVSVPLSGAFGAVSLRSGVAQGPGQSERVGRRILLKSFDIRYVYTPAASGEQCRILVVYDRQCNGSTPLSTDITSFGDVISPMNLNFSDRFVVLMDEITPQPGSTATAYVYGHRHVKINLEQLFQATTSAVSSISSGGIFLMAANTGLGIGVATALSITTRVRYLDA